MDLSGLSDEPAQVRTKKKEFLAQIERIIPWEECITLIQSCYDKGERSNKPYDLERVLKIYLVQRLYDLSDMSTVAEVVWWYCQESCAKMVYETIHLRRGTWGVMSPEVYCWYKGGLVLTNTPAITLSVLGAFPDN